MVNMSLRILSKPSATQIPHIFKVRLSGDRWWHGMWQVCAGHNTVLQPCTTSCSQNLGVDWEDRVLPSIGNEVVKATVAQYNAEQLLTQREKVSAAVSDDPCAEGHVQDLVRLADCLRALCGSIITSTHSL